MQTVIGIFKNLAQAQEAKSYLLANGFTNQNVDISTDNNPSGYDNNVTSGSTTDEGVGDRISHFFKNLFTDDAEATSHISAARSGIIVTVHAQTAAEAMDASDALNEHGAMDVNDYNNTYGTTEDSTDVDTASPSDSIETVSPSDSIKVIQEELQVGKQRVETGGVRLRSRIVERPVEESIRLREEHVNVERNTVDRPATEADFANFKEGTIELTENAERPVITKTARVVEEVSLGKEVSEREETIRDTVRHTEVDTENIDGDENYDGDKI